MAIAIELLNYDIDSEDRGAEEINKVAQQMQHQFMQRFGIEDLMQVD